MMRDYDIKFVNKEITPFGGLSLFLKMLDRCHFDEQLVKSGIPSQGSNRGYNPVQLILGLFAGVWCGASRFGHLDIVRYDTALCNLLGWKRGADHRAYQRYLNKFSQATNQRVFSELFSWFFSELVFDNYTLDFDSTVMVREGSQEGAAKGYNPKRPGRPSHHPLLAFVSTSDDSQLLAAPRQHLCQHQLPVLSGRHAVTASGQEGGTHPHGQRFLFGEHTRVSGTEAVELHHSLPAQQPHQVQPDA